MFYDLQTGFNPRNCHVILRTPGMVAQAIEELQSAPLFDGKVRLEATSEHPSGQMEDYSLQVDHRYGWHASKSPNPKQANIRQPSTTYPTDLFAPLRQSRRLVMDNFPPPLGPGSYCEALTGVYRLYHHLDVECVSLPHRYKSRELSGWATHIDFATREQAELALQHRTSEMCGHKVIIAISKPPLKFGIPWDTGARPSGHNGTRDQGTAEDTNFEAVRIR
jgi:hypothetical protein